MARARSKRKKPERDVHMMHEQEKTDLGIFNERTMTYLSKFFNKRIISKIDFPIATGKESDVYLAEAGESDILGDAELVAIKFFRVSTSSFYSMKDYIEGDPRFSRIRKGKSNIIDIWCRKEFGNLKAAYKAGVIVPKPYMCNRSILAMEFVGTNGVPSPKLKDIKIDKPNEMLNLIIKQAKLLFNAGLVHADLSEYNVLVRGMEPCIIDMGQAVALKHPMAHEFLERDVKNLLSYFSNKYDIKRDLKEVFDIISEGK